MSDLDLYRFLNDVAYDSSYDGKEAIIWVYHCNIKELADLLGYHIQDGGLDVRLQEDYIAVDITSICVDNDIDAEKVFNQ